MREISRGRSASLHTLCVSSGHLHGTITSGTHHAPLSWLHMPMLALICVLHNSPVLCPIPAGTFVALFISLSPLHDKRCSSTQKAALFAALTPSLISEPLPLRVAYLRSWVIAAL